MFANILCLIQPCRYVYIKLATGEADAQWVHKVSCFFLSIPSSLKVVVSIFNDFPFEFQILVRLLKVNAALIFIICK